MARSPKHPRQTDKPTPMGVEDLVHTTATRKNIPTVEHQAVMAQNQKSPVQARYPRANAQWLGLLCNAQPAGEAAAEGRPSLNRDLDPQLIWRGKDQQDWSDLIVNAPPLYIQEKVKPKALIDALRRLSHPPLPLGEGLGVRAGGPGVTATPHSSPSKWTCLATSTACPKG